MHNIITKQITDIFAARHTVIANGMISKIGAPVVNSRLSGEIHHLSTSSHSKHYSYSNDAGTCRADSCCVSEISGSGSIQSRSMRESERRDIMSRVGETRGFDSCDMSLQNDLSRGVRVLPLSVFVTDVPFGQKLGTPNLRASLKLSKPADWRKQAALKQEAGLLAQKLITT